MTQEHRFTTILLILKMKEAIEGKQNTPAYARKQYKGKVVHLCHLCLST